MTGGEPIAELSTPRVESPKPTLKPRPRDPVRAGLYRAEASRQAKVDKGKIDEVRAEIAEESGSDLPVPFKEGEAPKTRLQEYADGLEGPRDGDQELVAKYEAEIRARRKAGEFDSQEPEINNQVEEARERLSNPRLKEILPKAALAAKGLLRIKPDIDPQTRQSRDLPQDFYLQRASDLSRLLDLDFTPPADGSLGEKGEIAMLRFFQICAERRLLSGPLEAQLAKFDPRKSYGAQRFADHIEDVIEEVGAIAAQRFRTTVTAPNLDVFAEVVNPKYYQDFRIRHYIPPQS